MHPPSNLPMALKPSLISSLPSDVAVNAEGEIVAKAQHGDHDAQMALFQRYRPFVRSLAGAYFVAGGDGEDVQQEGWIGFLDAVQDYRPEGGTPFAAFAWLCIHRQLITAVKSANRHKHAILNQSVSLHQAVGPNTPEVTWADRLAAPEGANPETQVIRHETVREWTTALAAQCTAMEWRVLWDHLDGFSYQVIAEREGRSAKAVDNALQRVKRKAQRLLQQPGGMRLQ